MLPEKLPALSGARHGRNAKLRDRTQCPGRQLRSTAEYLERFVFENIRRPVSVFGLAAFTPPPELYAASQFAATSEEEEEEEEEEEGAAAVSAQRLRTRRAEMRLAPLDSVEHFAHEML